MTTPRTFTHQFAVMQRAAIGIVIGANLNFMDQLPTGVTGGWTRGAAQLDELTQEVQPYSSLTTISEPWYILGFNMKAYLGVSNWKFSLGADTGPFYGKFATLRGGLTFEESAETLSGAGLNGAPTSGPYANVFNPSNRSMIDVLWDPAIHRLPPILSGFTGSIHGPVQIPPNALLPVELTFNPPQPIPVPRGRRFFAGLWLPPSLLGTPGLTNGCLHLFVMGAQITLQWDDDYVS